MNTVLRPVGPEQPRVYWIRRFMVVLAAVVVVTLIWAFTQSGSADPTEGAPQDGDENGAPADGDEPADDGDSDSTDAQVTGPECLPEDLGLEVSTDAGTYAADENPVFTVSITNNGTQPCQVDAGDASREILVTSGSDRIWSSADCASDDASRPLLLNAELEDETSTTWERIRSNPDCDDDLPAPRTGGTYRVQVTLGEAESEQAVFNLE